MNPCKCGFWRTNLRECRCSDSEVAQYRSRISGPLLDRIELYVDVPSIDVVELRAGSTEETSATVRGRVCAARYRRQLDVAKRLTAGADRLLANAARTMLLSARGITRTLGVARTIACLAECDVTDEMHVAEALQYRVPSEDKSTV